MSDAPWFVEAFRAGYLDVYAHRDDAAAAAEIAFVEAALSHASCVLDAGCGAGRHARALAAHGPRVVGLDLSRELLRAAQAVGGDVQYVRGDVRALPFGAGAFDGVVSLFTSFGYFGDDENHRHLTELRRVLRPTGRLVLDFLGADSVRAGLVPRSEKQRGEHRIVEERAIRGGRVEKDVTMTGPDGTSRSWRESVRLYTRDELGALLRDASFRIVSVHGDLRGGAAAPDSPRCVHVAEAA